MNQLDGFPFIAFDTNCLVYYCFWVNIPEASPQVVVKARQTERARLVVEQLQSKKKKITTFKAAYDELQECVYGAVETRMTDREVEAQLGCPMGIHVSDKIKLHVHQSLEKKVRQLEAKSWFVVDRDFTPAVSDLQRLKEFFDSQEKSALGYSKPPSEIDRGLINFGFVRQFPLITNDKGISNFSQKLREAGLGFKIHNLIELHNNAVRA